VSQVTQGAHVVSGDTYSDGLAVTDTLAIMAIACGSGRVYAKLSV